jgi:hypothetical protein
MLFVLAFLVFMAVIAIVNILALVQGRPGNSLAQKAMLTSGAIGLLSLLVMVGSAVLVGAMLIVATFDSPQGYAFEVSSTICSIATLVSLALYVRHGRRGTRHT